MGCTTKALRYYFLGKYAPFARHSSLDHLPSPPFSLPGDGRGGKEDFRAPLEKGAGREQKTTHGRSPKKPTVGRRDDLQWVVETTYSGSSMRPTVGRNKERQEARRSLLELVRREESLIFSQMSITEAPTLRRVMNSHSVGTSIYGPGERPRIRSLLTRRRARSGSLDYPNLMSHHSWDPQCHHRQRMSQVHPPTA